MERIAAPVSSCHLSKSWSGGRRLRKEALSLLTPNRNPAQLWIYKDRLSRAKVPQRIVNWEWLKPLVSGAGASG